MGNGDAIVRETFFNICGDYSVERGIKPNNVTLPISFCLVGTGFIRLLFEFEASYWCLDDLKASSLEEFLAKPSLIVVGNWLVIFGRWFEDLLIYDNKSFGFL